jgi:hypothetical protein
MRRETGGCTAIGFWPPAGGANAASHAGAVAGLTTVKKIVEFLPNVGNFKP